MSPCHNGGFFCVGIFSSLFRRFFDLCSGYPYRKYEVLWRERSMVDTFYDYLRFYQKYAIDWWNHVGPTEYLIILSLVGIFGYLSMLRCSKRLS